MVYGDNFRILSDEEKTQYKFEFCEGCALYGECELVEEYTRFRDNHPPIHKSQTPQAPGNVLKVTATAVPVGDHAIVPSPSISHAVEGDSETNDLSYDQEELEEGCMMSSRHVHPIACNKRGENRVTVTQGIGDHYKIETLRDSSIVAGIEGRWEPSQPVFISAQTGQGKNYFIEHELIPYVKELNHRNTTKQRVLILSNRLALKQQIKNRLNGSDDPADEVYPYKGFADVMTYQSLLQQEQRLEKKQEKAHSRYIYVICDEAHFFTSDAMFNPHTAKVLSAIVRLFQDAVRVYMSATPYECLKYILEYEHEYQSRHNSHKLQDKGKSFPMAFYHFKRDYSYLDVKAYSSIAELYEQIVKSVNNRREKWLIFIDDIEKCRSVKKELEVYAEENDSPLVIKEAGGAKIEKVFAVDASSKTNSSYRSMVLNECLDTNTFVLISTSVLDNGVNLTGISNIVVSDMAKVKCLQMLGRARVSDAYDRKTLYVQRFNCSYVDKRIDSFETQEEAYHSYRMAYGELRDLLQSRGYSEYLFLDKYYNGNDVDWKNAKHWFGRPMDKPTALYLNEIAESLLDRRTHQYQAILDEMIEESSQDGIEGQEKIRAGQKYLEHQLSWFGKTYCEDDDITFADKDKAAKEFLAFLESYADSETLIDCEADRIKFQSDFTERYSVAFGPISKNKLKTKGTGGLQMNRALKDKNIGYKIAGKLQAGPWTVVRYNWEDDCPGTK